MSRRWMLKTMALSGLAASLPDFSFSQTPGWTAAVRVYLETLSRPDGGYAWEDQETSHLTPTFAVVSCYHALKTEPPNKKKLAEFIRTHHPAKLKKLEQEHHEFELQQIQSLLWLGEDASGFAGAVSGWKKPYVYLKQYERHGYPVFRFEMAAIVGRHLLGLPLDDLAPDFIGYLNVRRRSNGSFNNTPAADGGDGHVLNTLWGMQALSAFNRLAEKKSETIAWLRSCQLSNGGFTYQPKPEIAGVDDVAYTWAAVSALKLLGAAPLDPDGCIRYLQSLSNSDGGFGDRAGWLSNPVATSYALDAMNALSALDRPMSRGSRRVRLPAALPPDLKVFSIQIEAHGNGSPAEAVDLAGSLRLHLWGAKNAKPGWIQTAQAIADRANVPVKFFVADEEYNTWVNVPGLGTYSHTSDIIAPAGSNFGPAMAGQGVLSWPEFRERRAAPLQKAGGTLIWQFGENEELARIYLDDSMERGGYAAISTFHFGNPDFTNTEPFLMRYRGQIPFIALQDAHGAEPWWFADMTAGFRTVFLATEPSWDGWMNAVKRNWVAAIRHDAVSGSKTWMHAGSHAVIDFVRAHDRDWRWWDNSGIQRPMISIVAVRPEDKFEAARPEKGITLRVRCAWENTTQGLAKKPITELLKLMVDGAEVVPVLVEKKARAGFADYHHQFTLADPAPGKHSATAIARVLATNTELRRSIQFEMYPPNKTAQAAVQ